MEIAAVIPVPGFQDSLSTENPDFSWSQDRLTVRLTKDRREALSVIAGLESRSLQPIEVIDRAIAIACQSKRMDMTSQVATDTPSAGRADLWRTWENRFDALSDSVSVNLMQLANCMEQMRAVVVRIETLLPPFVGNTEDLDPTARANQPDIENPNLEAASSSIAESHKSQLPRLQSWLETELDSQSLATAHTAVVLVRQSSQAGSNQREGLHLFECRLVAVDGRRLGHYKASFTPAWTPTSRACLPDGIPIEVRQRLLSDSPGGCCLWCERHAPGGWAVHVHAFAQDGGVEAALATFYLADTPVARGRQRLTACLTCDGPTGASGVSMRKKHF